MQKKYIVRLTGQKRAELTNTIKKLRGTDQKVCRGQILLKSDVDGPACEPFLVFLHNLLQH